MNTTSQKLRSAGTLLILLWILGSEAWAQAGSDVQPQRRVLISLTDRKLAVLQDATVLRIFPIAVGAQVSPSPAGEFQVVNRLSNPAYYHPGTVIPAGKDNPLGPRWIGLSKKGYGIHGTNEPRSIGKAASHGCIRLSNRHIKELFQMIAVGDRVEIHSERDEQTARVFRPEDQSPTQPLVATADGMAGLE